MHSISISIVLILTILLQAPLLAQGIRGTIKNNDGEPIANASVFVTELKTSAVSNENGQYSVKLSAGKYTVNISHIGYVSQQFVISIADSWEEKNLILRDEQVLLNEVVIGKSKEDYAYTIMRKAIAKKKYHQLQCDSYQMTAYLKGTGGLTKIPYVFKNKMKKEGITVNEAYATESVSQFKFSQPNKFEEKVISVRTIGKDFSNVSPSFFLRTSFYNERVNGFVSPLAKSAFVYYQFKYEGDFTDKGHTVYKIRVTPRSKAENVFDGFIYIIDEYWAVHSVNLNGNITGFPVSIKQNYAEVAPATWLPVTFQFHLSGSMLGFSGDYKYLFSCTNYKVQLNKDLIGKASLVDEKSEKTDAAADISKSARKQDISELLASDKPLTRKQYVKLLNKYEKESYKEKKEPVKVISEMKFSIDSLAGKRDSAYWDSVRAVPLTVKEQKGYKRLDSLAGVAEKKATDSVAKARSKKFKPVHLVFGSNYRFSKKTNFRIDPTIQQVNFNTVEGVNVNMSGRLYHKTDTSGSGLAFIPTLRYNFSGENIYGKGTLSYHKKKDDFLLEGGRFVEQFNAQNPIEPLFNSISTLFSRRNFMKLYEKQYLATGYVHSFSPFVKLAANVNWSQRNQLNNTTDYSFLYKNNRSFSSNTPENIELPTTAFPTHQGLVLMAKLSYRPLQQYRIYNGKKIPLLYKSPEIVFSYVKGIKGVLSSDVDYDKVQIGFNHSMPVGAGNNLSMEVLGGTFLNSKRTFFMDYQHFNGNRTSLAGEQLAGSFRLLDYYNYSTNNSYIAANTHYGFRKFLITRIPELRLMGLKENVFVNYLKTTHSPHYYELGYSLDNIFRVLRLEAAAAFTNGSYKEFGLRFGVTSLIKFSKN